MMQRYDQQADGSYEADHGKNAMKINAVNVFSHGAHMVRGCFYQGNRIHRGFMGEPNYSSHRIFSNTPDFLAMRITPSSVIPSRYLWVIETFSCPNSRESVYRSMPFFKLMCAKVCRHVCGETRISLLTPAAFAAFFSILATASDVSFLPVRERKNSLS